LCRGFMRLYPNVELDVQFTDNDIGFVGEGYDIAIKYGTLQSSDHVARLMFERQPILVASPGYL
ncbi:LysR substrate-binding domain-containing protein, partial [Enterobacter hormaechei]|uniref:LysR substrate-binding domain-containing protein n=1 Tax=Enterobacter hormaechei TaxID=158836 RepID=UPI00403F1CAA